MSLRNRGKHRIRRKRLGRPFLRLWVGFAFASSGDGLTTGAVPLLAVMVNPHPFAVSTVVAADRLPWLLVALPAGAFADRFERGPVMAVSNFLRAVVIAGGAFLILNDHMTLVLLLLVVLVNASFRAIYYSALQATVPDLVSDEGFESANGVLSATESGTEYLGGPVVGSWLFSMYQAVPFFADAVALVLSCFPLARFRSKAPSPEGASTSLWEGVRLLFADRRLRILVLLVASLAGLQGMESGVLVLLTTTEWGVREGAYGLFLAVGAAGGLVGSLVANRLVRRFNSARTLLGAGVASGVGYLIMASSESWKLGIVGFTLVGFAIGAGSVVAISLRQRLTPESLMGRVGAAWRGIVWGAPPVGALVAGGFASLIGLRVPLVIAGILQFAVVAVLAQPLLKVIREGVHNTV